MLRDSLLHIPAGSGFRILTLSDLPAGSPGVQTPDTNDNWYEAAHSRNRKNVRKGVGHEMKREKKAKPNPAGPPWWQSVAV